MTMMRRGVPSVGVDRSVRRRSEEAKRQQLESFRRRYDKVKTIAFKSKDELSIHKFVVLPEDLFAYELSKSALAVYPVLCSRADFEVDRPFQISLTNIAYLAGVSEETAGRATEELVDSGLLDREMVQKGPRRFYVYRVKFIRRPMLQKKEHKGNRAYFYTCIIDSGIWAGLKPRAKALYLAMRASAQQNQDLYAEIEKEFYDLIEFDEYIRNRRWDVCCLSIAELCRMANITAKGVESALAQLEHARLRLIERVGAWTKVYLRPRTGRSPRE